MLAEEHLRRPGLEGEPRPGLLPLLATEGRIGEDHVEERRRANGCGDGAWGEVNFTTRNAGGQGPRFEFNYGGVIYAILPDIEYGAVP